MDFLGVGSGDFCAVGYVCLDQGEVDSSWDGEFIIDGDVHHCIESHPEVSDCSSSSLLLVESSPANSHELNRSRSMTSKSKYPEKQIPDRAEYRKLFSAINPNPRLSFQQPLSEIETEPLESMECTI